MTNSNPFGPRNPRGPGRPSSSGKEERKQTPDWLQMLSNENKYKAAQPEMGPDIEVTPHDPGVPSRPPVRVGQASLELPAKRKVDQDKQVPGPSRPSGHSNPDGEL
ncbi:hypothetical protein EYF80_048169 [Liparis tanakae]|uniref:Uncharacterized protein n=1 Tax=Liparis tanakae TaxID=230148 RepID=A0A4Z2FKX8_9TELE|nr:hypothetical protein EYF80_048169 [Liparis tanakae]